MDSVTYFVAVAFRRGVDGDLVAGEPVKQPTAGAAEGEARRMAKTAAGALAFSRTGSSATGQFEDAVVLRTFGDVPPLDEAALNRS